MEIRSARTDEIDAIRELLAQCGLPVEDVSGSAPIQFLVAVVDSDSTIVGCVGLEAYGTVGLLRSLAVAADARQRRIGVALVAEAESVARRAGIEGLYLLTTTASRFFQANGYEVAGREVVPRAVKQTTQFSTLCPATAVCMKKPIANTSALRHA
ncbi:arsenic resistance N-acetyltransferase ArsN2 [Paraburkholderia sp. HD33-4]|uniref:arsenic resistance N-acetyltransferase ArsN2 n=1 Tax=Paraburkholderia sp. HD33-4 TaxID=2883242 RepID=UPI001F3CC42C|nr:arsenic resistance N-acetyltransferase ArsN2 [Paraburkholderia sp. HD33-4]